VIIFDNVLAVEKQLSRKNISNELPFSASNRMNGGDNFRLLRKALIAMLTNAITTLKSHYRNIFYLLASI
jgi:hypothetical protein